MFGDGKNIKSLADVENVAEFIIHSLSFKTGFHLFNYVDKQFKYESISFFVKNII